MLIVNKAKSFSSVPTHYKMRFTSILNSFFTDYTVFEITFVWRRMEWNLLLMWDGFSWLKWSFLLWNRSIILLLIIKCLINLVVIFFKIGFPALFCCTYKWCLHFAPNNEPPVVAVGCESVSLQSVDAQRTRTNSCVMKKLMKPVLNHVLWIHCDSTVEVYVWTIKRMAQNVFYRLWVPAWRHETSTNVKRFPG